METKAKRFAKADTAHCVGCGCCMKVCPRDAIQVLGGVFAQTSLEKCIGCGLCAKACPASVISLIMISESLPAGKEVV